MESLGRWCRAGGFLTFLGTVTLLPTLRAQELPPRSLRPFESAATQLARAHRPEEVAELLDILAQLGMDEETLTELRESTSATLARRGERQDTVVRVARVLRQTADRLARSLDDQDEDARVRLAELLLALHDQQEAAHEALGHEQVFGSWFPAGEVVPARRRGEIEDALRQARRLPIQLSVGQSAHPLLMALYGKRGLQLRWGEHAVHSALSLEQTKRVVTEALRASALAEWLLTGRLEPRTFGFELVLVASRHDYERAIGIETGNQDLELWEAAAAADTSGFIDKQDNGVFYVPSEDHTMALLLAQTIDAEKVEVLSTGLVNLVSMAFLGTTVPGPVRVHTRHRAALRDPVPGAAELAEAGLQGCRVWLQAIALDRQDPPWPRILQREARAQVTGVELLKNTMMVEYLCGQGPIMPVLEHIKAGGSGIPAMMVEQAIGRSFIEVEDDWRALMHVAAPGLARRLETPGDTGLPAEQQALLTRLREVRSAAMTDPALPDLAPVGIEASLSRGAALHAAYLTRNRRQLDLWPDSQEEHLDRRGFTPEGARSARNSWVVRESDPEGLVDRWMAGVYRRLALLQPGLVHIGYGDEGNVTVVDTGSMVKPVRTEWSVTWPHDGMTGVPTTAQSEMPSPVPGQDMAHLGYPITLQLGQVVLRPFFIDPQVELTLHETDRDGPEVDCHVSSPAAPLNPDLVPRRAWILIPKAPLQTSTTYTVRARIVDLDEEFVWSFTTG